MSLTDAPLLTLRTNVVVWRSDEELVNPTTSKLWVKTPKSLNTLGPAPGVLRSAGRPANSVEAPSWFNPTNPQLGQLFNVLLPKGVPPVYAKALSQEAPAVQPTPEINLIKASVRTYLRITYSEVDLTPRVTDVDIPVHTKVQAPYTVEAEALPLSLTFEPFATYLDRGLQCEGTDFVGTYYDVTFNVPYRNLLCETGLFTTRGREALHMHLDQILSVTDTDPPSNLEVDSGYATITAAKQLNFDGGPTYYSGSTYTPDPYFGANHVYLETNGTNYVEYDIDTPIGTGDFTIECWFKANAISTPTMAIAVLGSGPEYSVDGSGPYVWAGYTQWVTGMYIQDARLKYFALDNDLTLRQKIQHQTYMNSLAWRHLVIERFNGVVRLYVDGVVSSTTHTDTRNLPYSKMALFSRGSAEGLGWYQLWGSVDELLVSTEARYQGVSFTPPTAPYDFGNATLTKLTPPAVLPADVGTFTLSGQAAGLLRPTYFPADAGSFTLAGQDANFTVAGGLTAETGAFTVAGQSAGLSAARVVKSAAATYTLSGQAAQLYKAVVFPGAAGGFTLAGQDATLNKGARILLGAVGAFVQAGQNATFTYTRKFATTPATYTLSGQAVTFTRQRSVVLASGAFTLAGQNATFQYNRAGLPLWVEQNYSLYAEITKPSQVFD